MKIPRSTVKSLIALAATVLVALSPACSPSNTNADGSKVAGAQDRSGTLANKLENVFSPQTYTVPAGTKILVRLDEGLSSAVNEAGDAFSATLDSPIESDGRTLAPAGATVTGRVQRVRESGKVKGKAELTLALDSIEVDGREYTLDAHPLTYRASGSEGKDAATIAGSAALGAVIGAITGGGKGAAVGAGVGGGAGAGYVLLTKGKEVELRRETLVRFALEQPVELPEAD